MTPGLFAVLDDGRCRRLRRRFWRVAEVSVVVLATVALLSLQSTGVGGDLVPAHERKSRRRASSDVIDETAGALSSVQTDPYDDSGDEFANNTRPHHQADDNQRFEFLNPKPADLQVECKPLKSKRYITDGFCTSVRPVVDFVCTGTCLPIRQLPWYAEFIKIWSHTKTLQYRCVDDVVRHRKVTFACDNGETRSYRIRVVRSCKCKRYLRAQNQSPTTAARHGRGARRRRRRKMRGQSHRRTHQVDF